MISYDLARQGAVETCHPRAINELTGAAYVERTDPSLCGLETHRF